MNNMYRLGLIFLLCLISSCSSGGEIDSAKIADTPENRTKLAERYFALVPFQTMLIGMGEEMASRMPPESKAQFLSFWQSFYTPERISEIEVTAKGSMAKHMTVDELQAFVRFMEDPAGRSAMDKMKLYMADIMPLIQRQAISAVREFGAKGSAVEGAE